MEEHDEAHYRPGLVIVTLALMAIGGCAGGAVLVMLMKTLFG